MKSCITLSLVPSLKGGPWVLWDDLESGIKQAANLGFDAIELFTNGPSIEPADQLDQLLSENNIILGAVGTGAGKVINGLTLTHQNEDIRKKAIFYIKDMIDFGAKYNAPAIIGSMQGSYEGEIRREQALLWLAEGLEILGQHAQSKGVKLIYEPLNRYETNLFNLFLDACDFLDQLSTNAVTLLADLFHMNIEENDIADVIKKGVRHLGHVHFADSNRKPIGCGHTNISPIADALKVVDYQGCISAEAFAWPDPVTAAKTTIDSYRKFFC